MTAARPEPIVRSITLSPHLGEAARGRACIAETAREAGFPEERVFDITVASSEAIANAIEHAPVKGEVYVRTLLHWDRLEVEVQGPGEFQAPDRLKKRESRGLGLPLMAKLSDHVALFSGPKGGTFVGLTFYRAGRSAVIDDAIPPSLRERLEENELMAAITQAAPVGLCVLDPELCYRWANPAYREFLEEPYRSQSLEGVFVGDAVPGSKEMGSLDILLKVSISGEPAYFPEYEFIGFARGTTYWRWEILPLREERPDPPFDVLVVISETTEQVVQRGKVETLGREAAGRAEWLTRLIDSMTDEVWITNADGRFTLANPAASSEFGTGHSIGYAVEDLAQQLEVYHADMTPRRAEDAPPLRALRGEIVKDEEEIVRTPRTGELRTRAVSAAPIQGADGTIIGSVSVVRDTTEHTRAEAALRESESKYRGLFDALDQGFFVIDVIFDENDRPIDLYYVEANAAATRVLGRDWTGKRLSEIGEGYEEYWFEIFGRVALTGESVREERYSAPQETWWDFYVFKIGGPESRRIGNTFIDITERKRTEEQSETSRRTFAELVERAPFGIYIVDADFRMAHMNSRSQNDTFRNVRPLIGRDFSEIMHVLWPDEVAEDILGHFRATLTTGEPYYSPEFTNPRSDVDAIQSFEWELQRTTLPDGRFGVICYYFDSSDIRQAERGLRESEDRYRGVVENTMAIILRIDPAGIITFANQRALDFFGYSLEELIGKPAVGTIVPPLESSGRDLATMVEGIAADPDAFHTNANENMCKDGRRVWLEWTNSGIYGPDGALEGFLSVGIDATERKRAEEALRESEALLSAFLELSPTGLALVDVEGRVVRANPAYRRYVPEVMPSRDPSRLARWRAWGPDGRPLAPSEFPGSRALRGEDVTPGVEFLFTDEDGRENWTRVSAVPFRAPDGTVTGTVATIEDIDQLKRMAATNERLYREQLDIAESLQLALLNIPSEMGPLRIGHLYRSATVAAQVGGDFYDVFEVKGGKAAVLMGDVCGHGIEAARTATLVKDVVHAFIHESLRPHQVLRRTNALLVEKNLPGFVTAFVGVLDQATGLLRFASAGHPEMLLRRASGQIELLGSGSSPLGIFPDATWTAGEAQVEPGDLLFLYTDGVIEARRRGELFGLGRLEKLLNRKRVTVERLPHLVLDQVLAFSEGTLSDDVAVLALSLDRLPQSLDA